MEFYADLRIDSKDFALISYAIENCGIKGMDEEMKQLRDKLLNVRFRATH